MSECIRCSFWPYSDPQPAYGIHGIHISCGCFFSLLRWRIHRVELFLIFDFYDALESWIKILYFFPIHYYTQGLKWFRFLWMLLKKCFVWFDVFIHFNYFTFAFSKSWTYAIICLCWQIQDSAHVGPYTLWYFGEIINTRAICHWVVGSWKVTL